MNVATLSITDLRRRPERLRALLAGNTPVILTVRDEAQGVILSVARYSELLEAIQDVKDRQVLHVLRDEPSVPYDDFVAELVAEGLLHASEEV